MQGLFYSVTATFTTLIVALIFFVVDQVNQFSAPELKDAYYTKQEALFFLQSMKRDVENMVLDTPESASFDCQISMTRNGRTKRFTFPTLITPNRNNKAKEPQVVQVTYELEGQARQVNTRHGKRDLYQLRRYIKNGATTEIQAGSSSQMVDFLVELIPDAPESPGRRIVSGSCPATIDKVYVEFHLAIDDVRRYANIARYSTLVATSDQSSEIQATRQISAQVNNPIAGITTTNTRF